MSIGAGYKASATKGYDEEVRAGRMAAWTGMNGKDDARDPFSRANCNVPTQSMLELALKEKAGRT
jgi:hypothetical protein